MTLEPLNQRHSFSNESLPTRRWPRRLVGSILLISMTILVVRYISHPEETTSVNAGQLTLAKAVRGTFERDIIGESVVGAQLSQTMTAAWNGVISFKVRGGDAIEMGQVLVTIDSPDLQSRLLQERAQLEALVADAKRAEVEERKQREINRENCRLALVAQDEASHDLQRQRRAYEMGAFPEIDVLRGEDTLKELK